MLKLWYPEGSKIRGIDASGEEVPCSHSFEENEIRKE